MLMIQGKVPSVLLDGIRALLVTHCLFLSEPIREFGQSFRAWPLLAEETLHIRRV